MKTRGRNGMAALLIAALVGATLPAAPARAESGDDSTGAAITVGLMVALRSDVDRYTEADVDKAIARAAKQAEASPVVLQAVTAPIGLGSAGGSSGTEVAGASIGWRMSF